MATGVNRLLQLFLAKFVCNLYYALWDVSVSNNKPTSVSFWCVFFMFGSKLNEYLFMIVFIHYFMGYD